MNTSQESISFELQSHQNYTKPIQSFSPSNGVISIDTQNQCQFLYYVEPSDIGKQYPIHYHIVRIRLNSTIQESKEGEGDQNQSKIAQKCILKQQFKFARNQRKEKIMKLSKRQSTIRMEQSGNQVMIQIREQYQHPNDVSLNHSCAIVVFISLSKQSDKIIENFDYQISVNQSQYLWTHLNKANIFQFNEKDSKKVAAYSISSDMLTTNLISATVQEMRFNLKRLKAESTVPGVRGVDFVDVFGEGYEKLVILGKKGQIYLIQNGVITKSGRNTINHDQIYNKMHIIVQTNDNKQTVLIIKLGVKKSKQCPFFKVSKLIVQTLQEEQFVQIEGYPIANQRNSKRQQVRFGILSNQLYYGQLYFYDQSKFFKVDLARLVDNSTFISNQHFAVSHLFSIQDSHSVIALTFSNETLTLIRRNTISSHYSFQQFELYGLGAVHKIQEINRRFKKFQQIITTKMKNSRLKLPKQSNIQLSQTNDMKQFQAQVDLYGKTISKNLTSRILILNDIKEQIDRRRSSLTLVHELKNQLKQKIQQVRNNNYEINRYLFEQNERLERQNEESAEQNSLIASINCLHSTLEQLKRQQLSLQKAEQFKFQDKIKKLREKAKQLKKAIGLHQ